MALTIENEETIRLAQELAADAGESVEDAVLNALRERLSFRQRNASLDKVIREIQERVAKLPVLDDRSPDELLGYDEWGLPH
ncbi:MAG TPA: type II toxin-antitoxin system VapB family antitoxin [Bryobacteraceae bacterium]|nr:type II toxin-antitoxin system VapB family antitoxin [Bryobacteraceae bacterium]